MSEGGRYLRLCEAFQYIDDAFLDLVEREKTEGKKKVRKSVRMFWSMAAACLCMFVLLPAAAHGRKDDKAHFMGAFGYRKLFGGKQYGGRFPL